MMWIYVAMALGVGVAALLAFAATRPDTYRVTRSIDVQAPPERAFALINDLRAMNAWNPFVKADQGSKLIYDDPASGPGASFSFDGGKSTGRIEIVAAQASTQVAMRLQMSKPMQSQSQIEFVIEPQGAGSKIIWSTTGQQPFFMKLMGVFFNLDKMLGGTLESGLKDLKEAAQRVPAAG